MSVPILYESHCHTPLCNHAYGEPVEYAAQAMARGLLGIIFTCHCPLPDGFSANVRMRPEEYETYAEMVAAAREEYAGRVDVRLGLESDYYPGVEPWLEKLHARYPLHHVLGSVQVCMRRLSLKVVAIDGVDDEAIRQAFLREKPGKSGGMSNRE